MTNHGLDVLGIVFLFTVGARDFSLFQNIPTGTVTEPAEDLHGHKEADARSDRSPPFSAEIELSYTSTPSYTFIDSTAKALYLISIICVLNRPIEGFRMARFVTDICAWTFYLTECCHRRGGEAAVVLLNQQ